MLGDVRLEEENKKSVFRGKGKPASFAGLFFYLGLCVSILGFAVIILVEKLPGVIIWIVGAITMVLMIQNLLIKRRESKDSSIFNVSFKIVILLTSILLLYLGVYVI